jgi:DNA-directed RNA polymerase subunit K/omega
MEDDIQTTPEQPVHVPLIPAVPAPPITSRFLYVDVAAMRAKQLRRGALSRLTSDDPNFPVKEFHKAERTAMEEVRRRLVHYDIHEPPKTRQPEGE